jgi:hypothetical protein
VRACTFSSRFCVYLLACLSSQSLSVDVGTLVSLVSIRMVGLIPCRSSCGDLLLTLCFQELWANSTIGSMCAHMDGLSAVQGLKYCSTHAFILSVCPSVLGWKAVDRFCWIPVALQRAFVKWDANHGSRSEIILLGNPNQGIKCFRTLLATPCPSIVLLQGMNLAALVHPWSTMVRIESNPLDEGRSVIRSIDMYWKGPSSTGVSKQ